MICAGWGQREEVGVVMGVLDVELHGRWLRVAASIAPPEPDVGLHAAHALDITACDEDGLVVALSTDEVASLRAQLERAYYRWRGRGAVHKNRP